VNSNMFLRSPVAGLLVGKYGASGDEIGFGRLSGSTLRFHNAIPNATHETSIALRVDLVG
jgi:hypothetical protein